MIGTSPQFGRWCWMLLPAVIALPLAVFPAAAQQSDRLPPGSPVLNELDHGDSHRGLLRELSGVPTADSLAPKLAVDPDTVVISPGGRDYLEPNAPNPFGDPRSETEIAYSLAEESPVELRIYDFFYNEVATLVDGVVQPAGRYIVPFDPPPTMPSGMYFYELKTSRYRELRRMIYVK